MLEPVRSRRQAVFALVRMSSRHHARHPKGQAGELVEPAGIEPATSWLQTRRSPS